MPKMINLSKLTRAEREARERRLEYNRKYDARKKKEAQQGKRQYTRVVKKVANDTLTNVDFAKVATLAQELADVDAKRVAIIDELKSLLS